MTAPDGASEGDIIPVVDPEDPSADGFYRVEAGEMVRVPGWSAALTEIVRRGPLR